MLRLAATERGDFEGLAITPQGDFWLTTSHGHLLRFREGQSHGQVNFQRFDTGSACVVALVLFGMSMIFTLVLMRRGSGLLGDD